MWPPSESGNTSASGSPGARSSATNAGRLTVRPLPFFGDPISNTPSTSVTDRVIRICFFEDRDLATAARRPPRTAARMSPARTPAAGAPRSVGKGVQLFQRQEPLLDRGHRRQLHPVDRIQHQPVLRDRHRQHLAQHPDRLVHRRRRQIDAQIRDPLTDQLTTDIPERDVRARRR